MVSPFYVPNNRDSQHVTAGRRERIHASQVGMSPDLRYDPLLPRDRNGGPKCSSWVVTEGASFRAPTHKYLKSNGFSIFGLQELFSRVRCLPDAQPIFEPVTNYLATLDPNRANALRGRALWRSLGPTKLFTNQL